VKGLVVFSRKLYSASSCFGVIKLKIPRNRENRKGVSLVSFESFIEYMREYRTYIAASYGIAETLPGFHHWKGA